MAYFSRSYGELRGNRTEEARSSRWCQTPPEVTARSRQSPRNAPLRGGFVVFGFVSLG